MMPPADRTDGPATRAALRALAAVCATALVFAAASTHATELAPGSTFSVRLASRVSSHRSRAGQPIEAFLIAPLNQADRPVVPAGSRLRGHVIAARGGFGRRAALKLRFDELVAPDGRSVEIAARVSGVDNARETVAADGTIRGLPSSSSPPSAAHVALLLAAHAHPVLLALVEAGRFASRRAQQRGIDYGPGVELELTLERAVDFAEEPARPEAATLPASPVPGDLARVLEGLPLQTVAPKAGRPSDLTNLLLVGSQAELEAAFAAAGWTRAEELRAGTAARGLLALAGKRAYRPAPVSLLELQGRPPDLVFEKQCNTLTKRHHVRLWGGFREPNGRPLWVGAASHDIGIAFSRSERAFTHRVDSRIDRERSKVVDDLLFTGRIEVASLVERPLAPRAFTTAAGAKIETDGRMAIVVLSAPDRSSTAASSASP